MANNQMSPELQKMLLEYENVEKQLQVLVLQRHQLQLQLNEVGLANEEIKKAESDVYKTVGSIMVKTNKHDAEKDLKDRKEIMEMRLTTLGKQEEKLRGNLVVMQKKLQSQMKGMPEE